MKNKEISRVLAGTLTASVVLNPFASNVDNVMAEVISNSYSDSDGSDTDTKSDCLYLSDIDYIKEWSNSAATIKKDANIEGNKISLLSGGYQVTFDKGMGAHANSTLVYDLSSYGNKYTRFTSYVGLDYSQKGKGGNGVKFTISASNDGSDWTVLKETGVLTATSESVLIDVDISNYRYLKLYADQNGQGSYDHSVYGDAKLVTSDYNLYSDGIPNLSSVNEYDKILRQYSIEENIEKNEELILKRTLVNRVGYSTLHSLYKMNDDYKEALNFLVNNEVALKLFVTNGDITKNGSYLATIKSFCNIYNAHKDELLDSSDNYFNLRLAISISLAYSNSNLVMFWISSTKPLNAVTRYEVYQDLVKSGIMDEAGNTTTYGKWSTAQFKALPIPLMKWAVDTRMNDDEIRWLADYALSKKSGTGSSSFLDAYSYIRYTFDYNYDRSNLYDMDNFETYNNKYNFSKYYSDYGTSGIHRLWMVFEEGSVCGGLAKTYANLAEVFGRPASVTGQPGHAATFVYGWNGNTGQYEWYLQNDIFGWAQSGNEYSDRMLNWGNKSWSIGYSASYLPLATDCIESEDAYNKFVQATILNLLADSYSDLDMKEKTYRKALEVQSINLDSYEGLVNTYKANSNKTSADYLNLAREIVGAYTYYPLVMSDLLNYLKAGVTESQDIVVLDLLRTNALTKAKVATASNVKQPGIAKAMANHLLGNVSVDLASFSFSGDKAGTIVINEKYKDSQIRVRYSLDGKQSWTETDDHEIKLSEDELAKINATNDIVVGLVGTDDVFTIDIQEGVKATNATLYKNDLENRFYGRTDNLMISLDEGKTWCNYSPEMRFTGRQVVKVKYKAYGVYLESGVEQYTFTEDTDTETKKYISIDHLSVIDYSSRTNANESGEKVISGSANDGWHSAANDSKKYITIKLDSIRYITAIDYMSSFNSGKIKNGEIYTSLDGETWVKSGTISDWQNNANTKTVNLDEPTAAKYVKIVATETHGGNSYFTCKMLNFYEDTTKTYEADPTIDYSTMSKTNEDVVATLELPSGCELVGEGEYTFTKNETHIFTYKDANGVEKTIEAKVDWIDKEAPTASIKYSTTEPTNGEVIAELVDASEPITILNGVGGNPNCYYFDDNGKFTFEFVDEAGNIGTATAEVTWIDKEAPTAELSYSTKELTNGDVTVTIGNFSEDGVSILNNDNSNTYTFKDNGSFSFEIVDKAGNKSTVIAEVDWIDKVAPTAKVEYSTTDITNGSVEAKLVDISESVEIVSEGGETHTFDENGTFNFVIRDKAGNESTITATVDWIDKVAPTGTVEYSDTNPTNKDVVATLTGLEEGVTIVSEGGNTHTFKENGKFDFIVEDKVGNRGTITAEVSWIDKVAPNVSIEYSTEEPTGGSVVATVVGLEEGDFIVNNDNNLSYTFNDNGKFEFVVSDAVGNETKVVAEVDWIDKTFPSGTLKYSTTNKTNQDVTVTLEGLKDTDVITNNGGSNEYTFKENGSFEFIVKSKAGNISKIVATVDWIDKTSPTAEVEYSTKSITNGSVVVSLKNISEDATIANNGGKSSYTFKENGSFEFILRDEAGNETKIPVEVTWIDKEAPEVELEYDIDKLTNKDVVVTLKGLKDGEKVVNNDGKDTYTFVDNGSFEFIVQDEAGNETRVTAKVDWIDKIAPTASVEYSTEEVTNGSVVAKLEDISEEGVTILNNDGKAEYTFDKNGVFEFIIQDKAGNISKIPVAVNWIDTDAPIVKVFYSTKELTNKSVVVTLEGLGEGDVVVNNDGKASYTFNENGTFEFVVRDEAGNETKVPVAVDWIDKVAPKVDMEFSCDYWTSDDVVVTLVNPSEDIKVLNTEDGAMSYTFKENGVFTFEVQDKAGNVTKVTADVDWIDKNKPTEVVSYSSTSETSDPVAISLNINTDEIEVLNNDGKVEYSFTENGTFVFRLRLRSTGYEFEVPVTVDWIDETVDETPVEDETTDNDSNNGGSDNTTSEDENNSSDDNNGDTVEEEKPAEEEKPVEEENNGNTSEEEKPVIDETTDNNSNNNTSEDKKPVIDETTGNNSSNSVNTPSKDENKKPSGGTSNSVASSGSSEGTKVENSANSSNNTSNGGNREPIKVEGSTNNGNNTVVSGGTSSSSTGVSGSVSSEDAESTGTVEDTVEDNTADKDVVDETTENENSSDNVEESVESEDSEEDKDKSWIEIVIDFFKGVFKSVSSWFSGLFKK